MKPIKSDRLAHVVDDINAAVETATRNNTMVRLCDDFIGKGKTVPKELERLANLREYLIVEEINAVTRAADLLEWASGGDEQPFTVKRRKK